MNFFKHFNIITYDGKKAINIMNSILLKFKNIDNTTLYFYYTIKDGDTPESVAYNVYGESDLHWTILLLNNIVDPYHDWALSGRRFQKFLTGKYGDDVNDIHHFKYEDQHFYKNQSIKLDESNYLNFNDIYDNWKNGISLPYKVIPITNTEYENTLNDGKREIKLLNKNKINKFVDQFTEALNGNDGIGLL